MQDAEIRFFEFGEFRLDARRRVLTKRGEPVPLKNRHFELLLALVENEGRIVSQDELIEKVWEGAFVEQSNLKKGVSALRQILGESATDGEFIKTIPRKGYSFVAPVCALADAAEPVIYRETEAEISGEEIEIAKERDLTAAGDVKTISESAEPFRETKPPSRLLVKKRRIIIAALILVSLSAAMLFGWRWLSQRTSALDLSRMRIVPMTTLGNVSGGGISRNGEYIYFGVSERGKVSLWLKHLKTGKVMPLLPPQKIHIYASDFAPDNESIYFWLADDDKPGRDGVYKIGIAGGEPQKISDKAWASLNFSPDGKRVAYHRPGVNEQNESGVFTANPDGSDEKLIFTFGGKLALGIIDWSPDGRFITYVANRIKDNQKEYFIAQVPASGGAEQIIVPPRPQPVFSAMWFPDGSGLAMTAIDEKTGLYQIWHVGYPSSVWKRVTNDLSSNGAIAVTPDGKGIYIIQTRDIFNLWAGDGDGQNFRQVTFDTLSYDVAPGWLDDETILYSAKTDDNFEIWSMSADGKNRRRITFDASSDRYPQATPDAQRILFLSNRSGTTQVWQTDRDGGESKQITSAASDVGNYRILPDGQTIVYSVFLSGQGWSLFKKTIDGTDFKRLPFPDAALWSISPDGKMLAYYAQTGSGSKIRLSSLEENKTIKEFNAGDFDQLIWTTDGQALLYDNLYNERDEIMIQPITGGEPRPLTNFNSEDNIWRFDLSPSGKRIVARRVRQYLDLMLIKLEED